MRKVVISNGFNKFHLSVAAAEAQSRGTLSSFITGAYPTALMRRALRSRALNRFPKLSRLNARKEGVPDKLVHSLALPEFLSQAEAALRLGFGSRMNQYALRWYARLAVPFVREAAKHGAQIYHYRAGFGHESVREAKRLGLITLCDHSIAHPAVLQPLIDAKGDLRVLREPGSMDRTWKDVLDDVELADAVVVNSDFVNQTFVEQGWPSSRVHVIYLGVDDAFLENVPEHRAPDAAGPLRLMFAGDFGDRKGADVLVAALKNLNGVEWTLEMAAGVSPEMRQKHSKFLSDPRVTELGFVSRKELATRMASAEIFLFPSFAEGSARVVFEALASGCYVITTPNSGSIVQDGEQGRLVPAGDTEAIVAALQKAAANRKAVFEVGKANADLVRRRYRQTHYGEELNSLYRELLTKKEKTQRR